MRSRSIALAWTGLSLVACGATSPPAEVGVDAAPMFDERAHASGIDFVHFNGMSGELYFVEIFGPGVGLFDYDNDGDLDLYVTQGRMLGPGKTVGDAIFPPADDAPPGDRLFRNELHELGRLTFTDVTDAAGIAPAGYGMGVAAGDYDGDGWIDLYVTAFGPNRLLHNRGDGTFVDRTDASGTQDDRWSTSAAFVDYDADGRLDLYVVNYVSFSFATHRPCVSATGAPGYCGPDSFRPEPDRLLRNLGGGRFADVSEASGVGTLAGSGLGVCYGDFDRDRRLELYVANDLMANRLWAPDGGGRLIDRALLAGCAFNADGQAESSMGVDAGDFDGDGDEDLFVTHLDNETNTLYLNDGRGWFTDVTFERGLGTASRGFTGFGTAWVDIDNDGWLDLLLVNGAVKHIEELARAGDPFPLDERDQVFLNLGDGSFAERSRVAGPAFELSEVGRGAAFGDLDNDGDTDVVVANNSGPLRLLLNLVGQRNRWVGVRMTDPEGRYDVIGTEVSLRLEDGRSLVRRVRTAASYLSSNDPRVLFGLGGASGVVSLRAVWPDGTIEDWEAPAIGRYTGIERGSGRVAAR